MGLSPIPVGSALTPRGNSNGNVWTSVLGNQRWLLLGWETSCLVSQVEVETDIPLVAVFFNYWFLSEVSRTVSALLLGPGQLQPQLSK